MRPLCEIVTEPDMHNADEVFAFLTALRNNILAAGLSDCDMEKGQMRCDANISVRPKGQEELGVKVELKNMNTISGVRNAVAYEIKRQIHAVTSGETIYQQTRRWDPSTHRSRPRCVTRRSPTTTAISPSPTSCPSPSAQKQLDASRQRIARTAL